MYRGPHQSEGVGFGSGSIGEEKILPVEAEFCCSERTNALQAASPQGPKVIPTVNMFRMQNSADHKRDARPAERRQRRLDGERDGVFRTHAADAFFMFRLPHLQF